jgi:hypothetical protein
MVEKLFREILEDKMLVFNNNPIANLKCFCFSQSLAKLLKIYLLLMD